MKLQQKHCKPCEEKTPSLTVLETKEYIKEVDNWTLEGDKKLDKIFLFKDFKEALVFVNKVGALAETEGHHPNIELFGWNKVKIILFTHSIDGLSENDFILASKIDEILRN